MCVAVVLNNAVLLLMMEYTFVFAGIQAAPQGGPIVVGVTVRVFLYIKQAYYYYYYSSKVVLR
jgi:hypothetical protein